MERIKFENLTNEQKLVVKVIYVNSNTDVVSNFYMNFDTKDKLFACYDTLLAIGYYGISFWVKDVLGEYTIKVVS